ncbi:MAG: RNA 2',3'-cyclic phosphodiesterase [Erythrobacter sp.]
MTHRLFVAIRPPASVRALLLDEMHGVEHVRWQDDDQLHLTLRYAGEVDRHQAEDLAVALGSISFDSFEIALRGTGTFESRGSVHTLWAGVERNEPLTRLQARIERVCQSVGLPPETRKFTPHVTLARLNKASGPVASFLARTGDEQFGQWQVGSYRLCESHLRPEGSLYREITRYPLVRTG